MYKYILLATLATCSPAVASTKCADHSELTDGLTKRFGESQSSVGITSNGNLFELYSNSETGTWTVILTGPDMQSCIAAIGDTYSQDIDTIEEPNL